LHQPIKTLQQKVTRAVNLRQGVFGPLWQGRYKAKLVKDQRYLDQLLIYIHLNPVSAGIVDDPAEYRWSGHREIIGEVKKPIVDVDEALRVFGKTRRSARKAYVRQVWGLVDPRPEIRSGETVKRTPEIQIVTRREVLVDRNLLGHDAEGALDHFGRTPDVLAADEDPASVGLQNPTDHVDRGGLAGAVGAEKTEDLALGDVERNVVHRDQRVEALAQSLDADHSRLREFGAVMVHLIVAWDRFDTQMSYTGRMERAEDHTIVHLVLRRKG